MPSSYAKKGTTPSKASYRGKQSSLNRNSSILNFFKKTDAPTSRQLRITEFAARITERNGVKASTDASGRSSGLKSTGKGKNPQDEGGSLFLEDTSELGIGIDPESTTTFLSDEDNMEESEAEMPGNIKRTPAETDEGDVGARSGDHRPGIRARGDLDGEPERKWEANVSNCELTPRFSDSSALVKRQKLGSSRGDGVERESSVPRASRITLRGPFIDESDSERDDYSLFPEIENEGFTVTKDDNITTADIGEKRPAVNIQPLVREVTSNADDDVDDDDGYARFDDSGNELMDETIRALDGPDGSIGGVSACPICNKSLAGLDEEEISIHVNRCLDSTAGSVAPTRVKFTGKKMTSSHVSYLPTPDEPLASSVHSEATAFSKLMAGNAEHTAWAMAAANEAMSRGKQTHLRTCPFYKIIQGFSICVDAFRYGAVNGCNAYFLSHFHSDHYVGLTASWCHGPIYCSKITANLVRQQLRVDPKWIVALEFEETTKVPNTNGVMVTLIEANHCPGSAMFLFEKALDPESLLKTRRILHCGDFRANAAHTQHPLLRPVTFDPVTGLRKGQKIDVCYLDTTYLSPKYSFPSQDDVMQACVDLCLSLNQGDASDKASWKKPSGRMGNSATAVSDADLREPDTSHRGRLLVVVGTYSIGKERICLAIARALQCKIYASTAKQRICECLEDTELLSFLTDDPLDAQIHMQTMFEIRAETLADYLHSMKPCFSRIIGFRPTGWTYRPPAGRTESNPSVSTVLNSAQWKVSISARDLTPQRGSTLEYACFGVPYSEHSSFQELTMFCCALRIGRIIPTVNVGNAKNREKMRGWIDRWESEKRKNGEYQWTG